jgi:hypothetical protein
MSARPKPFWRYDMNDSVVRRRLFTLGSLSAVVLFAACQDKRVAALDTGITRDSAVSIIQRGAPGRDTFPNVYKRDRFLIDGKTYEVLYFTPDNLKIAKDSTVPLKTLTPLVFLDNKLMAKGWDAWDSLSKAHNIPVQKR